MVQESHTDSLGVMGMKIKKAFIYPIYEGDIVDSEIGAFIESIYTLGIKTHSTTLYFKDCADTDPEISETIFLVGAIGSQVHPIPVRRSEFENLIIELKNTGGNLSHDTHVRLLEQFPDWRNCFVESFLMLN